MKTCQNKAFELYCVGETQVPICEKHKNLIELYNIGKKGIYHFQTILKLGDQKCKVTIEENEKGSVPNETRNKTR